MRIGILLALIHIFLSCTGMFAANRWLVGENQYFTVVSNASEKRTLQIFEELQFAREVLVGKYIEIDSELASERLTVVVCKDRKTISKLAHLYAGKPRLTSGFFMDVQSGAYAVVDASYDMEVVRRIIYHEYVHFLLKSLKARLPLWMNEGLAVAFSTIKKTRKKKQDIIEVGRSSYWYTYVLINEEPIPLDQLFAVTRNSKEYNSSEHGRGTYYAQSWALVHYMLFGTSDLPPDSFSKLIESSIVNSQVTESDFVSATGVNYDQMDKRIHRYIRDGKFRVNLIPASDLLVSSRITLSRMDEDDADSYIGRVILETRGYEEAYPILKKAFDANSNSLVANESMGFAMMRNGEIDSAQKHFDEAIRLGSKSSRLYLASIGLGEQDRIQSNNNQPYTEEELERQLQLFYKARELGETHSALFMLLGRVLSSYEGEPERDALTMLANGLYLHPGELSIGSNLAFLLYRRGDYKESEIVVRQFDSVNLSKNDRKMFDRILEAIEAGRSLQELP